jgi:transcriptional regulator with XRE-family HTH domain
MPKRETRLSDEAATLTKAILKVADRLDISQTLLASIVGLSESTISRMRNGTHALRRGNGKAFELAQLLVQLYDRLNSLVAGDETAARAWLAAKIQCWAVAPSI